MRANCWGIALAVVTTVALASCSTSSTSSTTATSPPSSTTAGPTETTAAPERATISKIDGLQAKVCLAALKVVSSAPRYEQRYADQAETECKKATDALLKTVESLPAYANRGTVDINDPHAFDLAPYGPAGELYDLLDELVSYLSPMKSVLEGNNPNDHSGDRLLRVYVLDEDGRMAKANQLASDTQ